MVINLLVLKFYCDSFILLHFTDIVACIPVAGSLVCMGSKVLLAERQQNRQVRRLVPLLRLVFCHHLMRDDQIRGLSIMQADCWIKIPECRLSIRVRIECGIFEKAWKFANKFFRSEKKGVKNKY